MKKTFLSQRNALLSPRGISPGMIAIAFVVVIVLVRLVFPDVLLRILHPVFAGGSGVTTAVRSFSAGFRDSAKLSYTNDQLADENTALVLQNRALTEQIADITKTLLTAPRTAGVLAGVVARPPIAAYDTLVVAAGSDTGVVEGMEAFGPGGTPLGIAKDVANSFTRITLFSAHGNSVAGWAGSSRVPLTLVGEGGGAFSAKVPKDANIHEGGAVYVPGPGAIPMGIVTRIDSDPSSPSATLRITPAANIFSITWVVLKDTGVNFLTAPVATSTKP